MMSRGVFTAPFLFGIANRKRLKLLKAGVRNLLDPD